jgi:hypothetical protein
MHIRDLPRLKSHKSAQVSTHTHDFPHHKRRNVHHQDWVKIEPGAKYTFPKIEGPASISCIWMTILEGVATSIREAVRQNMIWKALRYNRLQCLRDVLVKIYFDDENTPSVSSPMGDFFGVGFGRYVHYNSAFIGMTSGGYFCHFPMPFSRNCRIEIENTGKETPVTFYGAVTYERHERPEEGMAYFHAAYKREAETREGVPYMILQTDGKGHYVGCVLSMQGKMKRHHFGFLEGNPKIFVDSEAEPSLEYTGTEDYFMGGWYFNKGTFYTPYHGLTIKNWRKFRISAYRFHPEGIPFNSSIKVIIHHGEFDEICGDYSSVAYWYQE